MVQGTQIQRISGSGARVIGKSISYGGYLGAGGVLLFQCTGWLKDGRWTSLPLIDLMPWVALHIASVPSSLGLLTWANRPSSWFGLHHLMEFMPTVFALGLVGFLGTVLADWGVLLRRQAQERMRDTGMESSHRDVGPYDASAEADPARRYIGVLLAPVEQDIMRWLAINGSDDRANSLDLIARHIEYPAEAIKYGVARLSDQGFIALTRGRLHLSARGNAYCVEAGWAASLRRAG